MPNLNLHGTQYAVWRKSSTTASGTDTDVYLPANGDYFSTAGMSDITIYIKRTADTGTTTLQSFIEFYDPAQDGFEALLDLNNATAVQGVLAADGVYDERLLVLKRAPVMVDVDSILTVNTIHKVYQIYLPPYIRVRFRNGGTTVTNTFSASLMGS